MADIWVYHKSIVTAPGPVNLNSRGKRYIERRETGGEREERRREKRGREKRERREREERVKRKM